MIESPTLVPAEALPYRVDVVEHVAIEMPDGQHLSARLWLPVTDEPVPAILEHLPYRKDDDKLPRDQSQLAWLAGHGYACIRTDLRGTGDSPGVIRGEYLAEELHDGAAAIAWIAEQDWSDGNVGMWGISWGGFNCLQVAALGPPALKAVISVASTTDRYGADVHYNGGCVLASQMLPWATEMLCRTALPPTPRIVGDDWKAMWLDRLAATPPFIDDWLGHQTRDGFWRHGSGGDAFDAIAVPSKVVAGFADRYTTVPFEAVEGMGDRAWGLVGPWAHQYPQMGVPGPAIGFLQHALAWWDHWLRGVDNGIDRQPRLRIWMQEHVDPGDRDGDRPGRWIAEPEWPPPAGHVTESDLFLGDGFLDDQFLGGGSLGPTSSDGTVEVATSQRHGLLAGHWWGDGGPTTLPADQRTEDDQAATFTAEPADRPEEVCGVPVVDLRVGVDQPDALLAVRLCDVAPDGSSLLVTRGQLNLTHRHDHEHPEPLVPGKEFDVSIRMDAVAHVLPAGHRWRLSVATTNWPLAWPSPRPTKAVIRLGDSSRLRLPIRAPRPDDADLPGFGPPVCSPTERVTLREPAAERTIETTAGTTVLRTVADSGRHVVDSHGTVIDSGEDDRYSMDGEDPLSATVQSIRWSEVSWPGITTKVRAEATMRADETTWHVESRLRAWHDDDPAFDREWTIEVPRHHV